MTNPQQTVAIELVEDKIVECSDLGMDAGFIKGLQEVLTEIKVNFDIARLNEWDDESVEACFDENASEFQQEYFRGILRGLGIALVEAYSLV